MSGSSSSPSKTVYKKTEKKDASQVSPFTKDHSMRIPPQSIEAEQALLGSILLRPVNINDVSDRVFENSFYVEKHTLIYRIMLELHSRHDPIDLLSLSNRLKENGELENIGGMKYLNELIDRVPSSTNAEYYADIVGNKFALRKLINAGDYLTNLGFDEARDIEETLDLAEKKVFEATESPKAAEFMNIKDILPEVWETMERLHESKGEMRGVPTGFNGLDKKLNGFQKSDLVILAARPSMGKTSLALDIARKAAVNGKARIGFFSLEMSAQQLVDRMLAAESQVDLWKIRTGKNLTETDFTAIREGMSRLSQAPIFIDDKPGNSILAMRATARRLSKQHGLDMILVDYLQLMTTSRNFDSIVNQTTEISRSLKSLARELDVPVIALSQLSRAVESRGGKPRLSDLRDSGAIEQDADVVMFIHKERNEDGGGYENQAQILIEKHRNGATGIVPMYFDSARASFLDVETNEFDDFVDPEPLEDQF